MNWELKDAHRDDVKAFMNGDHQDILREALETSASKLGEVTVGVFLYCGPAEYTEWPDGFVHHPKDGPSYRCKIDVGFYRDGKFVSMEPPTYNMTVERPSQQPPISALFARKRLIKKVKAIS